MVWTRSGGALIAGLVLCAFGIAAWWSIDARRRSADARRYTTRTGQDTTITLIDGTRVRLAPRTTLAVSAGFGEGTRTVTVSGEAYFEVLHASGTPFVVQSKNLTTRVLGTTFLIRADADDSLSHVSVASGKVAIARRGLERRPILLTAGMAAAVPDSADNAVVVDRTSQTIRWVDGRLIFHNAPASDVLDALTRWYGYRFQLADSALADVRVTLGVSVESSQAALAAVRDVMNVNLTFDHQVIVVSARRRAGDAHRNRDAFPQIEKGVGR